MIVGVGTVIVVTMLGDAEGGVFDDLRGGGCDADDGVENVGWGRVGADGGDEGLDAG